MPEKRARKSGACELFRVKSSACAPSEEVAIYRALVPAEKEAAKERMSEGGKVRKLSLPSGQARDKLGAYVGKSGRTLEKQVALVEAAEAEPEKANAPLGENAA